MIQKIHKTKKPVVLIILDGFGIVPQDEKGNAVTQQTAPNIFGYMNKYASSTLEAHGKAVGLFPGQVGNSEAGHFNIGAGRVFKQDLVMISDRIKDGTFFKSNAFKMSLNYVQEKKTNVHIIGLLTDGNSAHSHPDHLYAMLDFFRKKKQKKVFLHLFTDGRDSAQHSAIGFLEELRCNMKNGEEIASICGRFYAMDRNKLWERTERAYNALVLGKGYVATSAESAIEQGYNRGETDEYIQPTIITKKGKPIITIQEDDAVYFFNARSDRARQLTKAFVQKDFNKQNVGAFHRKKILKHVEFVAMTDFGPDLPNLYTSFPSPDVKNPLAKVIGENYSQLYISETEKYAHVTFFINGGYSEPVNGEKRELIKSSGHYSYDEYPQMSSKKITTKVIEKIKSHEYDFVTVNFPNADMVGHTGNFSATKKAVRYMDLQVKKIVDEVLRLDGSVIITADHGNAEEMINKKTGEIMTGHTINPVPIMIVSKKTKGKTLKKGKLADIAPTLLKIMGIKKPTEMTGHSLL